MAGQPGPPPREQWHGRAGCTVLVLLSIAPTLTGLAVLSDSRSLALLAARVANLVLPVGIVFVLALAVTTLTAAGEDSDPPDGGTRGRAPGD